MKVSTVQRFACRISRWGCLDMQTTELGYTIKNFISYAIENIITVWSTWDVQLWYGGVYIVLYFSRKKLDDGSKTEL